MIHDPGRPALSLTSHELIGVMKQLTGRSMTELEFLDRKMSQAGLRPVGGRGRGARMMTEMDAARFLIAICCSGKISEIPDQVRAIGTLPVISASGASSRPPVPAMMEIIRSSRVYEDVLAGIISQVSTNPTLPAADSRFHSAIIFTDRDQGAYRASVLTAGAAGSIRVTFGENERPIDPGIMTKVMITDKMIKALSASLHGLISHEKGDAPRAIPYPQMSMTDAQREEGPTP